MSNELTIINPELSEIIYEVEKWNISSALNKITILKNSPLYEQLTIRDKMILLDHEIISYDHHNYSDNYFKLMSKLVNEFDAYFNHQAGDDIAKLIFFNYKLAYLSFTNKFDEAKVVTSELEVIRESILDQNKNLEDTFSLKMVCNSYHFLAWHKLLLNQVDEGIRVLIKRLKLAFQIDNLYEIYWSYSELLNFYVRKKEVTSFSNVAEEAITFFKKQGTLNLCKIVIYISQYLWILGLIKESLAILKNHSHNFALIESLTESELKHAILYEYHNHKGILFTTMGHFPKALEAYEKARYQGELLNKNYKIMNLLSSVLGNMAELIEEIGDYSTALTLQLKALEYRKQLGNTLSLAESYYQLIPLLINMSNLPEAKRYFAEFGSLIDEWGKYAKFSETRAITIRYTISLALLLMQEKTLKSSLQAQDLLKEIILKSNSQIIKSELLIDALIPLIELSIQELKLYQNDKILEDINSYLSNFKDYAEKSSSVLFKIKFLMLEARMKLVLSDFDEYTKNLKRIRELAQENELTKMLKIIDTEIAEFQREKQKWINLQTNGTIKERLDAVEMESYIKFVKTIMHDFG